MNNKIESIKEKLTLRSKKIILIFLAIALVCAVVVVGLFIGFSGKTITKLDKQGNHSKIFENVSGINVIKDKERYVITDDETINKVITALNTVKLKKKPIKIFHNAVPDGANRIAINGNTIGFNESYETFWIKDGSKEIYLYSVLNANKAKAAFEIKDIDKTIPVVTEISVGSDVYGLSASVKAIELNGNDPYIEVEYSNNTDKDYMNGKHFNVSYKTGATYKSCAMKALIFKDVGYFLNQGETRLQKYYLFDFDFSRDGKYRFETDFSGQNLWIDFKLEYKVENDSEQDSNAEQEAEINRLREKFPQYFNLPTVNGLELYVDLLTANPQFPTSANCRLFAGNNLGYTHGDIEDIEGVGENEMKLILSTYNDMASSEINIIVYYHPLSPYKAEITDGHVAQFRNKFDIYNKELDSYLHFKATVVDVHEDGTILVEAFEDELIRKKGNQFKINIDGIYKDTDRPIKIGDKLRIAYMGNLQPDSVIEIEDVRTVLLIDDGIY